MAKDRDDIAAEFARLVDSLNTSEDNENPEEAELNPEKASAAPSPAETEDPAETDISEFVGDTTAMPDLEEERLSVALVLTPISGTDTLAALMAVARVEAEIVQTASGAVVRIEVPASTDDAFEVLLGADRPMPEAADELARNISRIVPTGVVLLVSWLAQNEDIEPGVSGQVTARRYVAGEPEADLPAGLVIAQMDPRVEDLITGRTRASDYDDTRGVMNLRQAFKFLRKTIRGGTE